MHLCIKEGSLFFWVYHVDVPKPHHKVLLQFWIYYGNPIERVVTHNPYKVQFLHKLQGWVQFFCVFFPIKSPFENFLPHPLTSICRYDVHLAFGLKCPSNSLQTIFEWQCFEKFETNSHVFTLLPRFFLFKFYNVANLATIHKKI